VVEHRQPLLIRQLTPELLASMVASQQHRRTPAIVAGVPIMVGNVVLGAECPDYPPISLAKMRCALSTIAGTIGVAIQSAQLFEETRAEPDSRIV
jgi:hypothetical protein